jgi:pimeloyl-ACP methyl ester carboxylesterase
VQLITAARDTISIASSAVEGTVPYAPNFRTVSVDSGHFIQVEKHEELNALLRGFFVEVINNRTSADNST